MKVTIRYENREPSPEDYNRLRRDTGWPEMEAEAVVRSLPQSDFVVCAFAGDEMVGTGRVVGDGCLCFYIQDVIVLKTHQRMGIGAGLMRAIMEHISAKAVKDSYVGLMSAVEKESFYHRYGFTSRPTRALGCGMTLVWE